MASTILDDAESERIKALPRARTGPQGAIMTALRKGKVVRMNSSTGSYGALLRLEGLRIHQRKAEDGNGIYVWTEKVKP